MSILSEVENTATHSEYEWVISIQYNNLFSLIPTMVLDNVKRNSTCDIRIQIKIVQNTFSRK